MKHRLFSALAAAAVCAAVFNLLSCSDVSRSEPVSPRSDSAHITPASYADGDIEYMLTVSDGSRSVSIAVARTDGISEADILTPDTLAGVHIVSDGEGVRITPPSGELLSLTDRLGAGLNVFFEVMARLPSEGERTADGAYFFSQSGFNVTLVLSDDGMPRHITLERDGVTRHGELTFTEKTS